MADLAKPIMTIVAHSKWHLVFIISLMREISWYEFVLAIRKGKFDCLVNGIPSSEYPTPAKRPPFLYWIKVNKISLVEYQLIK
jgi:dTDP-4-dehydrorhamnose reductase